MEMDEIKKNNLKTNLKQRKTNKKKKRTIIEFFFSLLFF
jgi:hypothetical protein